MKYNIKLHLVALATVFVLSFLILVPSEAFADPLTITETRITTSGSATNPDIYEGKIVWEDERDGNSEIYLHDLSTSKETRITTSDESYPMNPAIYGNKIAYTWVSTFEPDYLIKVYDLSTQKETSIGQMTNAAKNPAIYGNRIVWDDIYILMYDLSTNTETQISSGDTAYNPAIYKDKIVWEAKSNIFTYNLSTDKETKLTTSGSAYHPRIYGDKIVWQDHRDGDYYPEIYMYDLSTQKETLITTNGSAPAIYEDKIVWQDWRNSSPYMDDNPNIYMYDLFTDTETQITTSGSASSPAIYGNRIVWQDSRNGKSDIYMATLSSSNSLVAAFSASPTSGTAPLKVQFTDNSTGSPTSWNWSFGDGTNSIEKNPTHTYSSAGSYTVNLTVGNEAGTNTATKTGYIKVNSVSSKLVANFSASPTSGKAPLIVNFTDKSTGSPTSWLWTFGDGTSSKEQNPVHKYTKSGNYSVTLRVWNKTALSTVTKSNYISVTNPVADFSASPTYGKAPLTVNFKDKSEGLPNCWYWNFGDGTSSNLQNPVHKYNKSGNYTVMLRVWSGAAMSSINKNNFISVISPPVAAFYATPISGKAPLAVKFIDKSTGLPKSWYWDFGDGGTSNLQSPTHTYTVGGDRKYYTVSLTVKNEAGNNTKKTYNYISVTK